MADQQFDIRVHGAQQTQSPVHGGLIPTHGSPETSTTGPIHGTNGNFTANQVVNGDFGVGTGWALDASANISGGKLNMNTAGTLFAATQAEAFTAGASYLVTYDVSNYVSGGVLIQFGIGSNVSGTTRNANGSYSETLVAGSGNAELRVVSQGATNLSIDNIVVKKIIPPPQ